MPEVTALAKNTPFTLQGDFVEADGTPLETEGLVAFRAYVDDVMVAEAPADKALVGTLVSVFCEAGASPGTRAFVLESVYADAAFKSEPYLAKVTGAKGAPQNIRFGVL